MVSQNYQDFQIPLRCMPIDPFKPFHADDRFLIGSPVTEIDSKTRTKVFLPPTQAPKTLYITKIHIFILAESKFLLDLTPVNTAPCLFTCAG